MKIPYIVYIRIFFYLFLVVFGGAGLLYDKFLTPFLTKNEQNIDDGIEYFKNKASLIFGKIASYLTSFILKQFNDFVRLSIMNPKKTEEIKKESIPESN